MSEARHIRPEDMPGETESGHENYEYTQRLLTPERGESRCQVSRYEIPPHKSSYPYHYHAMNEECFYIVSGQGLVRTPQGEAPVRPGDFLYFPPGESGAHKLTNTSDTETLVYIDFDVEHELEVAFYPDSGKLGIWGKGVNKLFKLEDRVKYYDGE